MAGMEGTVVMEGMAAVDTAAVDTAAVVIDWLTKVRTIQESCRSYFSSPLSRGFLAK